MEEILKALMEAAGGAQPAGARQPAGQADLLGDLLRDLADGPGIGGGNPHGQQASPAGDLLEAILGGAMGGGGGAANAGGLGGILGMLGGGGMGLAGPLADMLAEKTGLSPAIANAVVAFFLAYFLGGRGKQGGGNAAGGLNLDHLLDVADDDDAIDTRLAASGMPQALSNRTGMDVKTASTGLQELIKILAGQRVTPRPVAPRQANLKSLLDTWQTD